MSLDVGGSSCASVTLGNIYYDESTPSVDSISLRDSAARLLPRSKSRLIYVTSPYPPRYSNLGKGESFLDSLPIKIAPTKALLVPISNGSQFKLIIRHLSNRLRVLGISHNVDSSTASLRKRYARDDEVGTPLAITIDHTTLLDGSITLRERDSIDQVRSSEDEVVEAVKNIVTGAETWTELVKRLPSFAARSPDE